MWLLDVKETDTWQKPHHMERLPLKREPAGGCRGLERVTVGQTEKHQEDVMGTHS